MPTLRPPPLQPLRPAWSAAQHCRRRTHGFLASEARPFTTTTPDLKKGGSAPRYAKKGPQSPTATAHKGTGGKRKKYSRPGEEPRAVDIIREKKRVRAEKRRAEELQSSGEVPVRRVPLLLKVERRAEAIAHRLQRRAERRAAEGREPPPAPEEPPTPKPRRKAPPKLADGKPLIRFHIGSDEGKELDRRKEVARKPFFSEERRKELDRRQEVARKPFFKAPIPINVDDSTQWHELLKDERMKEQTRKIIGEARGIRTGVNTKDKILDNATWQRLKQELTAMAKATREDEKRGGAAPVGWKVESEGATTSAVEKVVEDTASADGKVESEEPITSQAEQMVESTAPADEQAKQEEDGEHIALDKKGPSIRFVYKPERWQHTQGQAPPHLKREPEAEPEAEPKPDPVTVRQRLRDAIGNIRSSLVDQIEVEDDAPPSRYRQDKDGVRPSKDREDRPAASNPVMEQRLEELEYLLYHAMKGLRELQGYGPEDGPDFPYLHRESAPVLDCGSNKADRENADVKDFKRPIRYLSRDPSRPLPHMTEQAIPPAMLALRESPAPPRSTGDKAKRRDSKKSLWDKMFSEANASKATPGPQNSASLFDELFPEHKTQDDKATPAPAPERHVPKLSLDLKASEPSTPRRTGLIERNDWVNSQMQRNYAPDEVVVVQLSAVSKSLSEEDIKRLVPSSSAHIEGWSDPDFIKVIPTRDPNTLDRRDAYLVLFRTVRAARAFQERVRALHETVRAHTPSSLTSPLPAAPGYTDSRGRDVHAATHAYTIGPAMPGPLGVYCAIVPTTSPATRAIRAVVRAGGYDGVVGAPPGTRVLFWLEGAQPSIGEVRRTLRRDGKERGVQWGVVGGVSSAEGVVRLQTVYSRNEAVGEGEEHLVVRKVAPRYVVSFEDRGEAARFVRRWHRVAFRWREDGRYENGEGAPEGRVQVLW